ncbi:MAG: hypothetical protein U5L95_04605 [Candidatus Saccharibacteria bacterium]|nr:hypothetical protein [Candidatus Saccharibacteria bacterium]
MEFMNRGSTPSAPQHQNGAQHGNASTPAPQKKEKRLGRDSDKGMRITTVILLFSMTILLVALAASFVFGPKSEKSYVEKDKLQAVFLNGGQVYFGNITDLNDKYLRMNDIFYLRVNQTVQPDQEGANQPQQQTGQNDISLVKLGCELHRPANEMLINRSQVIFWENLKDESGENTVPGAVKNYHSNYPDGQECQSQNNNTGGNGGSAPASEESGDGDSAPATGAGSGQSGTNLAN